jgi:hypothetical protein
VEFKVFSGLLKSSIKAVTVFLSLISMLLLTVSWEGLRDPGGTCSQHSLRKTTRRWAWADLRKQKENNS